jgi:hypothetical protein
LGRLKAIHLPHQKQTYKMITEKNFQDSMTFEEFYSLSEQLVKNKDSSGENKSDAYVNYTKLSFTRMKRILKTTKINPEITDDLKKLDKPITLLVLNESWCGDAAQSVPVFQKMLEHNPNIKIRVLLRDEHPEVMDQYLTNGSKSIPKVIALDENLNELGTWGPQPHFLNQWYKEHKANPTMQIMELKEQFKKWYTKDKGATLQNEMIDLLKEWNE